jgi:hypothetical protein
VVHELPPELQRSVSAAAVKIIHQNGLLRLLGKRLQLLFLTVLRNGVAQWRHVPKTS